MFRNISLFILLSLLISAASASTTNTKPYEPPGLNQGDRYQLVFVTSSKMHARSGDVADYNDFVQFLARGSSLPKDAGTGTHLWDGFSWKAVVSTRDGAVAKDNAPATTRVYDLNGTPIHDDSDLFYSKSHTAHIVRDQNNQPYSGNGRIWSGSHHDGNVSQFPLGGSFASSQVGQNSGSLDLWLNNLDHDSDQVFNALYALSPLIIVDGARLKLVNNLVKSGSSTATESDWTLIATDQADGNNTVSGTGGFNATFVTAGTYELSQTTVAGFINTKIVCSINGGTGVEATSVTLNWHDEAECTFTNIEAAKVEIRKNTHPTSGQEFGFQSRFEYDGHSPTSHFVLSDGTNEIFDNLPPGIMTVTEDTPTGTVKLTGLSCSDSDSGGTPSTGDVSLRTATINLDPGETVVCTFTNTEGDRLMIEKVTIPGGATGSFPFSLEFKKDGSQEDFSLVGGQSAAYLLEPGDYTITEDDPTLGFDLTKIKCLDTDTGSIFPGDLGTRTATLNMTAGENVFCTFTNTQRAKLTVVKNTVGGDGAFEFDSQVLVGGKFEIQTSGRTGKKIFEHLLPMTYDLAEDVPAGWELTSADCDNGKTLPNIVLNPGDDVTCTFVNIKLPVAIDDQYSTPFGTLTINAPAILTNDIPYYRGVPTAVVVDVQTILGDVTLVGLGGFEYTPTVSNCLADYEDSFDYHAEYGSTVVSSPATVRIFIHCDNHAPVAQDDAYSIAEDGFLLVPKSKGFLSNDRDPDGDHLLPTLVKSVEHGVLQINFDGSFTYQPEPGYGHDGFFYTISDGALESVQTFVALTINHVNHPPLPGADAYSVAESGVLNVTAKLGLLANDLDLDGDTLLVKDIPSKPTHGILKMELDGSFTYTPEHSFSGADSFTYLVTDGTADVGPTTVSLTVNGVNNPPLAAADVYSVPQDGSIAVPADKGVLANDLDLDGDQLFAIIKNRPTEGFPFELKFDGSFSYAPTPGFEGTDSFTYVAFDGHSESHEVTVTLNVHHTNLPPVALADKYSTARNAVLQIASAKGLLRNDSDPDGNVLMAINVTQPLHGVLNAQKDGSFTYTPKTDYAGSDSFTYQATDGSLKSSVTTVSITVNATNRAPVAHDDAYSIAQDTLLSVTATEGLLANDTDADGDNLSVHVKSYPGHGNLQQNPDGSFSYQPESGYSGADSYTYAAMDSLERGNLATVNITVNAVNHEPLTVDDPYSMNSGTVLQLDSDHGVLANDTDPDGDKLKATLVSPPTHGALYFQLDGSFTYTPSDPGFGGTDSFTYKAFDGKLESEATATIDLHKTNEAPVANDDSYTVDQNTSLNIAPKGLLLNDTDADGDKLKVVSHTEPTNGTLYLLTDGGFSYMPNSTFTGSDSFTYKVSDGKAESSLAAVTIDVTPTYRLRVDVTGQGSVTGGLSSKTISSSIDCPGSCEATFPAGSTATLTAHLNTYITKGSWSWSGACPDDQSTCDYEMDADKDASVVFSCILIDIPAQTEATGTAVESKEPAWVCNNIEATKGFEVVAPNGEITFRAKTIKLGPGFKVEMGGVYHAETMKP